MNRATVSFVSLFLLAGCGHTSGSTSKLTSRYQDVAANTDDWDGPRAKSPDNDRPQQSFASDHRERRRKARLEMIDTAFDLAGDSLASSTADRRMHPGAAHDRNDALEAFLYATLIRISVKALRDITSEMLSNER